ncbi:hypothetical protein FHX15_003626 [Rhizobium sp. BK650]|uniref:hypothetical protein n=1 Tax=Rhizobium sp. BK650 TaxID=2586990 RepID=UPI001612A6D4|nr:hypothetical protein [Rhizobium sp. BK650]MBB3658379.1 hypothetical protein [Rhizobium sp. BK650]
MANARQISAPTTARPARFTVGRDRGGRWIVQDREGLVGGLFINEAAALHFAAEECNHNADDICRVSAGVVLDFAPLGRGAGNIH